MLLYKFSSHQPDSLRCTPGSLPLKWLFRSGGDTCAAQKKRLPIAYVPSMGAHSQRGQYVVRVSVGVACVCIYVYICIVYVGVGVSVGR